MLNESLTRVLEATEYLDGGEPAAPSVVVTAPESETTSTHQNLQSPSFQPDAYWHSNLSAGEPRRELGLKSFFKYVDDPANVPVAEWQREIWNQGSAPLLWLISPSGIELHNGLGVPISTTDATHTVIKTFSSEDDQLRQLNNLAGRLAMESGQVWDRLPELDWKTSVDQTLLRQIALLERVQVSNGLSHAQAQSLIGRAIFAQYLVDRGVIASDELYDIAGCRELHQVFADRSATEALFVSLRDRFNGDMFETSDVPADIHLNEIGHFLAGGEPGSGQKSLFPYRFDVIPVELISSIYEQFVHTPVNNQDESRQRQQGVFYIPLTAVSLVLDEVFDGLEGHEHVLDFTCGSGVFLVEALRRLVLLKSNQKPTRQIIREVLHNQVHGVDISEDAIRIAAFSLYLAAMELDPNPRYEAGMKFKPLIGGTLRVSDAFDFYPDRKIDVIVGNPPWSFAGRAATEIRRKRQPSQPIAPRSQGLDFVQHALNHVTDGSKIGLVLSATPFFAKSPTSNRVVNTVLEQLENLTLIDLSELDAWLFPNAKMPSMVLLGTYHDQNSESPNDSQMELVRARWSPSGQRTRLIELSSSDISQLPIASRIRNQDLFKAAFVGCRQDLLLMDRLVDRYGRLDSRLEEIGRNLYTGLIHGNRSKDASSLIGMPFARDIQHFSIPANLPSFDTARVESLPERDIYEGPMLLVRQNFRDRISRVITAVSKRDMVYTNSYYGFPLGESQVELGYLIAGILSSSLSSWYLLMSSPTFGVWKCGVSDADLLALPFPDIDKTMQSEAGKRVVEIVRLMHEDSSHSIEWHELDDAVCDVYDLDDIERLVVQDGLLRASWQWKKARVSSVADVNDEEIKGYAETFLSTMDEWLADEGTRSMRSEVLKANERDAFRVVRFMLNTNGNTAPNIKFVRLEGALLEKLARIGSKANVPVSNLLVGNSDLRIHAEDEVCIIKPTARRNWLRINAIEDADSVVQDVFNGIPPEPC